MTINDNTEEYERCVVCGRLTDIPVSMPIESRKVYDAGIGQMCPNCAERARSEKNR